MTGSDPKADLHHYLRLARDTLLRKLDGVSEYDARRPLVRTGTNLLGLVKHLTGVEVGYFGMTFGRPFAEPLPWMEGEPELNADMWATADESRQDVVARYRRATAHADSTIETLPLDALGQVPHWPEEWRDLTLHKALVHVTAETHRHAGHADILRELIDGAAGLWGDDDNLPPGDEAWWEGYRRRLELVARQAAGEGPGTSPA